MARGHKKARKSVAGRRNKTTFKKGMEKTGGRKKGTMNKLTSLSIEHRKFVFGAIETLGSDGSVDKEGNITPGTDGAQGWWIRKMHQYPKIGMQIAARLMPVEVNATVTGAMAVISHSLSEKEAAAAYNSMLDNSQQMPQLEKMKDGSYAAA